MKWTVRSGTKNDWADDRIFFVSLSPWLDRMEGLIEPRIADNIACGCEVRSVWQYRVVRRESDD